MAPLVENQAFELDALIDTIAATAAPNVGWVWRDNGYGVHNIYATNRNWAELPD